MKPLFRGYHSFEVTGISEEEKNAFEMLEKHFVEMAKIKGAAKFWHNKYDYKVKEFEEFKNACKIIKRRIK